MREQEIETEKPRVAPLFGSHLVPIQSGWALEALGFLDRDRPGFLLATFLAKPAWRQAAFAALAAGAADRPGDFLARSGDKAAGEAAHALLVRAVAERLLAMRPQQILEAAWGDCPIGAIGALERMGFAPLEQPELYAELRRLLVDPNEKRRRLALQHCGDISTDRLQTLLELDPALTHPKVFPLCRGVKQAQASNKILDLLGRQTPGFGKDEVYAWTAQTDGPASWRCYLKQLLDKIREAPALPFELDAAIFKQLRTRYDFTRASVRHKNCVVSKFLTHAVTGRMAYVEYLPEPAIAVLVQFEQGWMLGRVHAPENLRPARALTERVRAAFVEMGVPCLTPPRLDPACAALERLQDCDSFWLDRDALDRFAEAWF